MSNRRNRFYNADQKARFKPEVQKTECQLIALDTNVFIDMSHHMDASKDKFHTQFYAKLRQIVEKAESGLLKFVISPSVFAELNVQKMSPREIEFLKKYCVLLKPKDKEAFAKEVVTLTREYIKSGIMKSSSTPWGDAMIMAECTIAGLNVLTNNYKDFIIYEEDKPFYKHDSFGDIIPRTKYRDENLPKNTTYLSQNELKGFLKYKMRYRALDIASINNGMSYGYINKRGFNVVPMPFTTIDFIGKRSEKEGLWNCSQFTSELNTSMVKLESYEMEQ